MSLSVSFFTYTYPRYLKRSAILLRDDFNSDVPDTVDELCSLPGVGPKMAFLALQIAWDKSVDSCQSRCVFNGLWARHDGIGVDVHVHRITNLLGWHKPPTKTPEQTRYVFALIMHILQMTRFLDGRLNLQSWLPKDLYGDINHMLVGFGQVIFFRVSNGIQCFTNIPLNR
jgi:endonuclease-3